MSETTEATPAPARTDTRVFLLIPGVLACALVMLAFLPNDIARDTAVRLFVALFITIAAVDVLTLKIPNVVVYPMIVFALAATAILDLDLVPDALLGGGALLGIMFVVAVMGKGAMGMGDVKLSCFSGCVLGVKNGVFALLFGFSIAAGFALIILILRLRGRKDVLPIAPFLAAGAIASGLVFDFLLTAVA